MNRITWKLWFAWHPVKVPGRWKWHWLKYMLRDQYANRPARYHYATSKFLETPWLIERKCTVDMKLKGEC